ncbi:retroviral-like aspartic protease [Candidatus Pacearchaeota archaeon]|nr:retroviral-like aspartic protease [Candidatus Pacearchaeota archaeon]
MTITFKYKRIRRPDNSEIKTPSILVTFGGAGAKYDFMVLVDSGADVSVIPKSIAELLGLNLAGEEEEASGIGGVVPAVESSVQIEIHKGHEHYSFVLPVKVILDDSDFPILLGREGFFDKFVVTFNQSEEKLILKRVQEGSY